jgi:hypothetical protein
MKLQYITKFLFNRYVKYKINVKNLHASEFFQLRSLKSDIVFFNINSVRNRSILSSYLFFLDIFYFKPPLFLSSYISYRGRIQTKITVLSVYVNSKRSLYLFLKEFFFFLYLRNFDIRRAFFSKFFEFKSHLNFTAIIPINVFSYTLRNLFHLSLLRNYVFFTFFYFPIKFLSVHYSSFFLVILSIYFFLFDDNLLK